ncbi:hypothetical protein ABC195_04280 [Microbacterium sp. 2P01SA-2]|uniref:hypothetical protein n=1 Tax=unclassified Microbacterium TaxID=2609290 RepID=UPI00399FCDDD
MSQNYGEPTSGSQAGSGSGTAETAKHEAGEVAGTAKAEAGHVVDTAKQEAASVASEAKSQAKQVYAQTKQQLTEQAASQQQRVADGLRSIGDELDSLAQNSENPGIATDLVRQVSSRVSGASDWLSQRDPGSLVSEVKSFARRKPGVFIAGALIAGVVAGRLTRALAEGAKEEHDSASGTAGATGTTGTADGVPSAPSAPSPAPVNAPLDAPIGTPGSAPAGIPAAPSAPTNAPVGAPLDEPIGGAPDAAEPTPLYDSSVGRTPDEPYTEGIGERRDDR